MAQFSTGGYVCRTRFGVFSYQPTTKF